MVLRMGVWFIAKSGRIEGSAASGRVDPRAWVGGWAVVGVVLQTELSCARQDVPVQRYLAMGGRVVMELEG